VRCASVFVAFIIDHKVSVTFGGLVTGKFPRRINSVACEEVSEERVRAARGYSGPLEWVLMAVGHRSFDIRFSS
jgi:hypothetical protein